jgi:hypothetical protein
MRRTYLFLLQSRRTAVSAVSASTATPRCGQHARGVWTFLIVFAAAIAFHRFYWKPSGISDAITRVTG